MYGHILDLRELERRRPTLEERGALYGESDAGGEMPKKLQDES